MLLELIRKYGEYCKLAGESAGTIDEWLTGWLSHVEVRSLLSEIQHVTLPQTGNLMRIVLEDDDQR